MLKTADLSSKTSASGCQFVGLGEHDSLNSSPVQHWNASGKS